MSHKIEQPIKLKNGNTADDPRLGRVPEFDERSRDFDVRETLEAENVVGQIVTRTWRCSLWLNQGSTPACTGNSRSLDLAAYPKPQKQPNGAVIDERFAQELYHSAQDLDEWPGDNYEGSSVLGALKASVKIGYIGEYRWAFNHDDWLASISNIGGSVVGTTWLNSMFDPRPSGLLEVDPSSGEAGGHAYYFRGIAVNSYAKRKLLGAGEPLRSVPLLRIRNSWWTPQDGTANMWGKSGEAYMWADDYFNHLWDGGEQSVVTTAFHR